MDDELFSDFSLQFIQERAHARLIAWGREQTGITEFNLGVAAMYEPGTRAMKELLDEIEER